MPKGGQVVCELEFRPSATVAIAGMVLVCTVANVRKYQVSVSAVGGKPALEFSTLDMQFGECILAPSANVGAVPVTRMLRISNREADRDVSLQCTFERRPHLDVGLDAAVLRPGDVIDVPITFLPLSIVLFFDGAVTAKEDVKRHNDDARANQDKIPLLGDLPVLGNLFKNSRRSAVKTNLMVFLRPQIVRDRAGAVALSQTRYNDIRAKQQRQNEQQTERLLPQRGAVLPEGILE